MDLIGEPLLKRRKRPPPRKSLKKKQKLSLSPETKNENLPRKKSPQQRKG